MPWSVERWRGDAGELHERPLPDPPRPSLWWCEVDRPALVLGSSQPEGDGDLAACEQAEVRVVRRRSGGGAVLLVPDEVVWLDVVVPTEHPRWHPDIGRAAWWLGDAWAQALTELGVRSPTVHRGRLRPSVWSRQVCFAGIGPGEVLDAEGAKLVGISQRRTRHGARFQCAVHLRWRPECYEHLLTSRPPAGALRGVVATLDVAADDVRAAVTEAITAGAVAW
jgi:lipoate-protein ligase A